MCKTKQAQKPVLNICTYNTRTIYNEHLDNLLAELEYSSDEQKQLNWDVIGICETKLHGKFKEALCNDHVLYHSGLPESERRMQGVGFLVKAKHVNSIIDFNSYSERTCLIKLKSKYNNIAIIQVYAPDTSYSDADVDAFYVSVQHLINSVSNRDELIVMGDFNAKVGAIDEPGVIGNHSNIKRGNNERGEKLVSFCLQNSLMITNTFFKHRRQHTWTSPDGKTKNTVDYIMLRQSARKKVLDSHVLNHPCISDHRPVRCRLQLSTSTYKRNTNQTKRFDVAKLADSNTHKLFEAAVSENLTQLLPAETNNAQELMDTIAKSLINASSTVLGTSKSPKCKPWISDTTRSAIQQKLETRRTYGSSSTEYKIAKANIKKLCKIDKETQIDNEHKLIGTMPYNQQYFTALKKLKLSTTRNVKGWEMKSPSGKTLTNIDDILENWAQFYENLYYSNRDSFTKYVESTNYEIPPILRKEIVFAIERLKNNKAPGPDGITAEMLKAGGDKLCDALLELANLIIIMQQECPDQLTESEIIVLFKKGDLQECGNYRPICLLSHVYKLIMMVIYNRISPELLRTLPLNQAAYQPGRSTTEQIQTLQQTIEKLNEFNSNGVILFIDYTKAFDSVDQEMLWATLSKYTDINSGYINILAKMYEHTRTRIRTDLGITRMINILRGVKQGDLASAVLFCIVLMVILLETFEGLEFGIQLGGNCMTDIDYADDAAIMTVTIAEMNIVSNKLHTISKKYGLSINFKKTKAMLIGNHAASDGTIPLIQIDNNNIDVVSKFEHLGRILTNNADDEAAVAARIGKGWAAFQKVKSIITSRHLSMTSKRKTIETYVMPSMLYASETIAWKPRLQQKATVFQNHLMRWMCGKRLINKIRITELRRMTGMKPIMTTIKARKLQWYGHVKRSGLPVRTAVEGLIQGKRSRGRPRHRWRDDISDWTAMNWNDLNQATRDRDTWRTIVDRCKRL